jgi:hypothetical protein
VGVAGDADAGADLGAPGKKKGEFVLEAAKLASGGKTTDAMLVAVLEAQHVNRVLGGAFVGPGEVDGLPDDFLDACEALAVDVPRMAKEIRR